VLVMDLMIGLIIVTRVGERRQPRSLTPATVNLR